MQLDNQINSIKTQLQTLPAGQLICCTNKDGSSKWYQSDGQQRTYIPKKERPLAEQLALKKYLTLKLEELSNEKKSIDFYLKHHHLTPDKATLLLTTHPEYANLLASSFTPLTKELLDWSSTPYTQNPKYPEQCIHKSSSGNLLRSKSEALIDSFLYQNKIPFRYECILQLGEITLYPDFTIRHPRTGVIYYWEHFGLMDNPNYIKNTHLKLGTYLTHGIIPTIQLITTYETKDNPLSPYFIEKTIQHYFL